MDDPQIACAPEDPTDPSVGHRRCSASTEPFRRIYAHHADDYDRLVEAEDCDDQLLPAMAGVCPLAGIRVAEVGVGTGRITRLLVRAGAARIVGVDQAPAMLTVARRHLTALGSDCRWQLDEGDAGHLPLPDGEVDLYVAGWALGHTVGWRPTSWRSTIDGYLLEADRVTRPGGSQILFETLGTGRDAPGPPTPGLARLYDHLEQTHGFSRHTIRTDYRFASVDDAVRRCGLFFGDGLARRIRERGWTRVPEWTGMWWRRSCQGAVKARSRTGNLR